MKRVGRRRRAGLAICAVVAGLVGGAVAGPVERPVSVPRAEALPGCDRSHLDADELTEAFAQPGLGGPVGFAGGDYPRAFPLPDRRVLWMFQDVFWSDDDDLRDSLTSAAHNGGLIQDGGCFTRFGGPGVNAIGNDITIPLSRWFWPLDGELGHDGAFWLFMVEMLNPNGTGADHGAVPASTWVARLDPVTLSVISFAPAPDPGPRLYGWSVVSDTTHSYLFGHCYRQFVDDVDGPAQFDESCMPHAWLARVPVGRFDQSPEYWTGSGWSGNAGAAVPVMSRGFANPMSVQWFGDTFVSVSKVGDWWGATIEIDVATSPTGPWQKAETIWTIGDRKCGECGNYGAFAMPWLDDDGRMTIALSNGAPFHLWYEDASLYRPTFYSVEVPGSSTADPPLDRGFGHVAGTSGLVPVDPVRLVDTREADAEFGRLVPGAPAVLDLRDRMPAGAEAVVLNVATADSDGAGWVKAAPCSSGEPPTSTINPTGVGEISNAAVVPIGDGRICWWTLRPTALIVDLDGWLTTGSDVGLRPVEPRRLLDTRLPGNGGRLRAGQTVAVQVAPPASDVVAVSVNVTAVDPGRSGYVTAWPCDGEQPVVANLNPQAGVTRPNLVTVKTSAAGTICLFTLQDTDLVVDLFGEYAPGAEARYGAVGPLRLRDTRAGGTVRHASDTSYVVAVGDVVAAQVNMTATEAIGPGYLTAHSCTTGTRPLVANVNHVAFEASGNAALAPVGRQHTCLFPFVSTHVVVDLFGVWTTRR